MELKEVFKPSEEVLEKMNALMDSLNTVENDQDIDLQKEDCTGCWGGTCANGITGRSAAKNMQTVKSG